MIKQFEIGGLVIPLLSAFDLRCEFPPRPRETILPMGDGSLLKQVYGGSQNKLNVELSGSGNIPPGLDGLDYTLPLLFKSAAELSISSAASSIAIPAERRSDAGYEPWGRAQVGHHWVTTPVVMTVDQADLTPVTDATLYQVLWYPEFNVLSDGGRPNVTHDVYGAVAFWQLTLMQV